MPSEIVMRHRTPQFTHVFSGEGYAAGYYSYLWSDVLAADAWEAFTEAGGPWDEAVAKRLRERRLLGRQHRRPADGYRAFRGRDPGSTRSCASAASRCHGRTEERLDVYSSVGAPRSGEGSVWWRSKTITSFAPARSQGAGQ